MCLPRSWMNEAGDSCDADVGASTLVCCSTSAPSRCFPSPREAQKMRISEIAFFSEKLFANINIKPICMRSRPRTGKPSSFYLMHNSDHLPSPGEPSREHGIRWGVSVGFVHDIFCFPPWFWCQPSFTCGCGQRIAEMLSKQCLPLQTWEGSINQIKQT